MGVVRVGRGTGTGMRGEIDGFMVVVTVIMMMTLLLFLPLLMMLEMMVMVILILARIIGSQLPQRRQQQQQQLAADAYYINLHVKKLNQFPVSFEKENDPHSPANRQLIISVIFTYLYTHYRRCCIYVFTLQRSGTKTTR